MRDDRPGGVRDRIWRGVATTDHLLGVSRFVPDTSNAIVAYHSVGEGGYGSVTRDRFARDVAYLTSRYEVVDLPAVLEAGDRKRVALTFDDGYRDFYDHALPVLREHDVPATVFVVADALGDPTFQHDDVPGRAHEYLTESQVRVLVDEPLVSIGNHTRTHPGLATLGGRDEIEREVVGAKRALEEGLGVPVDRFSYPYGSYNGAAVDVVREGHDVAVTSDRGLVAPTTDRYRLPRIDPARNEAVFRWELTDLSWQLRGVFGSE